MEKTAMQKIAEKLEADVQRRVDEKLAALTPEFLAAIMAGKVPAKTVAGLERVSGENLQRFVPRMQSVHSQVALDPVRAAAMRSKKPVIVGKAGTPTQQMDAARTNQLKLDAQEIPNV